MSDENLSKERPTPPPVPSVDRVTGKVTFKRSEDVGQLDGWASSTDPNEGGVQETRFNDPAAHTAEQSREFNQKPSNRII